MRNPLKNMKVLIAAAAVSGFVAVPLYSYAIDYTASGGSKQQNSSGYTAGENVGKQDYLSGRGLQKNIRTPQDAPVNIDAPDAPQQVFDAIQQAQIERPRTSAGYGEERDVCTPSDRATLVSYEKTLKKYISLTEKAYTEAQGLAKMSESSINKSAISDVKKIADAAQKVMGEKDFIKNFWLYKKCNVEPPDSEFLPIPRGVLAFIQ